MAETEVDFDHTEGSAEEHASRSEALLKEGHHEDAVLEAEMALDGLPFMARAALTRGRGLLHPALAKRDAGGPPPDQALLHEAGRAFMLAQFLDSGCEEAEDEMEKLQKLKEELEAAPAPDAHVAEAGELAFISPTSRHISPTSRPHLAHISPTSRPHLAHISPISRPHLPGELDVIIVGAGAAGVGCALMLTKTFGLDPSRVLLVERGEAVGETFRRWPAEMRFISPSFNQQGWTSSFDLNSIAHGTSPAYSLHNEHPSGTEYAHYLSALAGAAKLNVRTQTEVASVEAATGKEGAPLFSVGVRSVGGQEATQRRKKKAKTEPAQTTETLTARYVVWAAGEFQYPRSGAGSIKGAELCVHSSSVRSWAALPGEDYVLIGGYESGADAAVNLAKAGKRSTVLASSASWNVQTPDPSSELAPYTAERLREVTSTGFSPQPALLAPLRVLRVEKAAAGGFNVIAQWKAAEDLPPQGPMRKLLAGQAETGDSADTGTPRGAVGSELVVHTTQPPVMCTGFEGSVAAAARDLFSLADKSDEAKGCLAGAPLLSDVDESTKVPGVFLAGPQVRHGDLSFCFVYKFRQRFAIVANAICRGLGRDTTKAVENCRKMNMFLDDFTCCKATCGEAC